MPIDLHHSVPAASQDDILQYERAYTTAYPPAHGARLVVEIFGRPHTKIMQSIFEDGTYLHQATGQDGNIYFLGYGGPTVRAETFSVESFIRAQADLQEKTSWRYSGDTDLVVLTSRATGPTGTAVELDYTRALCVTLEQAIDAKAIPSAPAYLQSLIQRMTTAGLHPAQQESDGAALGFLASALRSLFVAIFPEATRADVAKAFVHCTKDISRPPPAAP